MPAAGKNINVEFLNKLKDLTGIENVKDFALKCEKTPSNMHAYLEGKSKPGDAVLRDCARNAFVWQIKPLGEVVAIAKKPRALPTCKGVYVLYDSAGNVLYIGQAKNFRTEVDQTLRRKIPVGMRFGPSLDKTKPNISDLATHLSLYEIENAELRHNVEALLLRVFINQTHNSNIGRFK